MLRLKSRYWQCANSITQPIQTRLFHFQKHYHLSPTTHSSRSSKAIFFTVIGSINRLYSDHSFAKNGVTYTLLLCNIDMLLLALLENIFTKHYQLLKMKIEIFETKMHRNFRKKNRPGRNSTVNHLFEFTEEILGINKYRFTY